MGVWHMFDKQEFVDHIYQGDAKRTYSMSNYVGWQKVAILD